MKPNRLFVVTTFFFSVAFCACNEGESPVTPPQEELPEWFTSNGIPVVDGTEQVKNSSYFIHGYLVTKGIDCQYELHQPAYDITQAGYTYAQSSEYTLPYHLIRIDFSGETVNAVPVGLNPATTDFIPTYDSLTGNDQYVALSRYFGDTHYNQRVTYLTLYGVLADEFTSVDIVSDRTFDATHSAGASLGDVVKFVGSSPYKFIRNGYADLQIPLLNVKDHADCGILDYVGTQLAPISKTLDTLTADDLKLIFGQAACLLFTTPPPAGKHTFTITFRSAEKTLTSTLAVEIP